MAPVSDDPAGRPKVVVLATTFPAVPDDGTPQFVLDLSRGLARTLDVTIVAPRVPGGQRRERLDGMEIRRFSYFPRRWESLADGAILPNLRARPALVVQVPFLLGGYLLAALSAVRRTRAGVVHAHWLVPGGLVAAIVRAFTGTPFVVTVHGADAFALRGAPLLTLKRWVIARAALVGLTSTQLRDVLPVVDGVATAVVPMGVDVDGLRRAVGQRQPQHGRFLFVGRLAAKKGVDVALRAVAEVPAASLVVAGDGPERPALERLAQQLGVAHRVTFTGRLSRAAVSRELRRAGAVVVPSRVAADGDQDTTPLVMSEAMSAHVPVVASALGGLTERIEHGVTGLLVDPDSVASLAAALRHALDDPQSLERCADEAQRRIAGSPLDLAASVAAYERFLVEARGRIRAGR